MCHTPPSLQGKSLVEITEDMYCPNFVPLIIGVSAVAVVILLTMTIALHIYLQKVELEYRFFSYDLAIGLKDRTNAFSCI